MTLRLSKRVIYFANKALKLPKISEKEKFQFTEYKSEAQFQMGSTKSALATLKEYPFGRLDAKLKCSFGYHQPNCDSDLEYTAKMIGNLNWANLKLQEEEEGQSQSNEIIEAINTLSEHLDKNNTGGSPAPLTMIYFYLKNSKESLKLDNIPIALQFLKRRKLVPSIPDKPFLNITK